MLTLWLGRTADNARAAFFSLSMQHVVRFLLIVLAVFALIYNLDLHEWVGIPVVSGQYYAFFIGLVLVLVFLMYPVRAHIAPRRWYDYILALVSAVVCFNYGYIYYDLVISGGMAAGTKDFYLGIIAVIIVCEAVRRTTGIIMVIVALVFLFHAFFANHFPSFLIGPTIPPERIIRTLYLSGSGMFGFIMGIAATYIIAFVSFGAFMVVLGAGNKFTDLALSLVGHKKGGAPKMAVVSSSFLGTLTGDPISNVGISGSVTIPMMKKQKVSPEYAAAVETTASVGGLIMPPMMGAIIFLMVEITGIPYVQIMKAALVPALLYFFAIFCQIDFHCKKHNLEGLPADQIPDRKQALKDAKFLYVVFGTLIYLLVVKRLFPVDAAYYSLGIMIVLFMIDRKSKVTLTRIFDGLEMASRFVVKIAPLIACAGIILGSLSLTGTGLRMSNRLLEFTGDSLLLLVVITGIICYFLGLGVSAMLAYVVLASIVAPAMVQFGVPVIAAHLFIIYVGLSGFFTPPYAVVALTASGLAGADFYKTCWQSMKLAIVAYIIPLTIVLSPVLLLEDVTLQRFIVRAGISVLAIYFLSAGVEGYFYGRSLYRLERLFISAGALTLFIPYYLSFDIAGLVLLGVGVALFFANSRALKRQHAESA